MRTRLQVVWLMLLVLCGAGAAAAQTPRTARFNRVTTLRPETGEGQDPARFDRSGSFVATAVRDRGLADPLRPYTGRPGDSAAAVPAASLGFPEPRAAVPEAPRAAPRSYFPAWRSGQSPNRNVGSRGHCTAGRASFLARGLVSPRPGLPLLPPSPGMPGF